MCWRRRPRSGELSEDLTLPACDRGIRPGESRPSRQVAETSSRNGTRAGSNCQNFSADSSIGFRIAVSGPRPLTAALVRFTPSIHDPRGAVQAASPLLFEIYEPMLQKTFRFQIFWSEV